MDMEDGVAHNRKEEARSTIATLLGGEVRCQQCTTTAVLEFGTAWSSLCCPVLRLARNVSRPAPPDTRLVPWPVQQSVNCA